MRSIKVINLDDKFSLIEDRWHPYVVAELNGQQVKLAKIEGPFLWHSHETEDELFLVLEGNLQIELRDHVLKLGPGEMCVIPRGVEHLPVADGVVHVMLFEPATTKHTGEVESDRTIHETDWI